MTPTEQNIFFSLLRTSIWQRHPDLTLFDSPDWSWSPICKALESHALLAIAADSIMTINDQLPLDKQLNPMQSMAIFQYSASIAQTHYELNNAIRKSFAALNNAGCHPILLKGQGLATLYPQRNTRSCGDIDIYVGLEEYDKSCEAIRKFINNPEAEASAEEEAHHYEIHDGKIAYEIHRYPSVAGNQKYQDKYYKLSADYLHFSECDSVKIESTTSKSGKTEVFTIPVPSLQYNVLYVFNHLCQHIWEGGVGLKQLIDWMLLLNHALRQPSKFDVQLLRSDLKAIGLFRAWRILGGILVYQFGFPKDFFPFWKESLAQKSQGYYIDELLGGSSFGSMSGKDNSYKQHKSIQRKVAAFKHYYYLCRPISIISPRFALERFSFYCKEAILRPGRNK